MMPARVHVSVKQTNTRNSSNRLPLHSYPSRKCIMHPAMHLAFIPVIPARRLRKAGAHVAKLGPPACGITPAWSRIAPAIGLTAYTTRIFILPPFPLDASHSLREALSLSLNFSYITPTLFPHMAPVFHPCYEALFHIIVAWALLFLPFLTEDERSDPAIPATPFLLATPLLTNLVYLPYLLLRTPPTTPLPKTPETPLLSLSESRILPIISLLLLALSLPWALFARPEFGPPLVRIASFQHVISHDTLAHAFVLDALAFSTFQSWLVSADAARRTWMSDGLRERAIMAARFVPLFGLAFYVWQRPRRGGRSE